MELKKKRITLILVAVFGGTLSFANDPKDQEPTQRDPRLDSVNFYELPLNGFLKKTCPATEKDSQKICLEPGTKFNFKASDQKSVPIGFKKGEKPKVVLAREVFAENITKDIAEEMVMRCYPVRVSYTKYKNVLDLFQASLKYLATEKNFLGFYEDDQTRQARTADPRSPLKLSTWYGNRGVNDDAGSDRFFTEVMKGVPSIWPDESYADERFAKSRPDIQPFKLDRECLKKSFRIAYAKAADQTDACIIEFKPGSVSPGNKFDFSKTKTIKISSMKLHSGGWSEFTVNDPKIASFSCPSGIKNVAHLGRFIDLSTSDLKIEEKYLSPKIVAPIQVPSPASSTKSVSNHPSVNSAQEKNVNSGSERSTSTNRNQPSESLEVK